MNSAAGITKTLRSNSGTLRSQAHCSRHTLSSRAPQLSAKSTMRCRCAGRCFINSACSDQVIG